MCALGQREMREREMREREMREREGGEGREVKREKIKLYVFMPLWMKKSSSKSHKKQRTKGPTLALSPKSLPLSK